MASRGNKPGAVIQSVGSTEFLGPGLPVPSTDIKLLMMRAVRSGMGEPAKSAPKGPQVDDRLLEKPEANAAAFTTDGYFRTGRCGVFDEKGLS